MASMESIGSCSLDVDATASESSSTLDGRASSVSQRTLHSASVDLCSGGGSSVPANNTIDPGHKHHHHHHHHRHTSRSPTATLVEKSPELPPEARFVSELFIPTGVVANGAASGSSSSHNNHHHHHHHHHRKTTEENVTGSSSSPAVVSATVDPSRKPPSYINISCSVSGYTSYSCYNSKVREGLRSRDNSPARAAFTNGATHHHDHASRTINIELKDDDDNDDDVITNGVNGIATTTLHTSRLTLNVNNGDDAVDRSRTPRDTPETISPVTPTRNGVRNGVSNERNKHTGSSSNGNVNGTANSNSNAVNGKLYSPNALNRKLSNGSPARSVYRDFSVESNKSSENGEITSGEQKSLIQQRIERLYGPAALAQGFRLHRERRISSSTDSTVAATSTADGSSSLVTTTTTTTSSYASAESMTVIDRYAGAPPVFKHLHKDFCEQLKSSKSADSNSVSPSKSGAPSPPSSGYSPYKNSRATNGTVPSLSADDAFPADKKLNSNGDIGNKSNGDVVHQNGFSDPQLYVLPPASDHNLVKLPQLNSSTKNGQWFIDIMNAEKDRIRKLITKAEDYLNEKFLSDDVCGRIRAAIGKANLLLSQKFEQFKGLCVKNMNQVASEPFPTTLEDLAGFWDMVLIQVGDIHGMFEKIELLRLNNWIVDDKVDVTNGTKSEECSVSTTDGVANGVKRKKPVFKKPKSVGASQQQSAKSQEAAIAREEARQRLLEAKRKGRQQSSQKVESPGIEIYVPDERE